MNILFLSHRVPYPPNEGGKIRAYHMLRHLSERHQVVVGSLAESEEEYRKGLELNDLCKELIVELVSPARRWAQALAALPTSIPSSLAYFWSSRLHQRLRQAATRWRFDAVIVHCAFVAPYIKGIDAPYRLLDYVDMDSGKWSEYARHRTFPLSLGYRLEAAKLQAYERKAASNFHQCAVTTQGEFDAYQALGVAVPCAVLPNGVDTRYFQQAPHAHSSTGAVIAFLGRMDYYPNVDGVVYFAREVFPLVRARVPHAEFRIIGMNPTADVRELAKTPGIVVTGSVPDVRPHMQDAAVTVAPLRIARGTQNKVLESIAMGIPVVATTRAARGVQAEPDRHLLVSDTPEGMADQVVDLLQDAHRRRSLAMAAREQVQRAHNWATTCAQLDQLLRSASARLAA